MIPWSGIPFLRFTIALTSGIAGYFIFNWDLPEIMSGGITLCIYFILFIVQKRKKVFFYSLQPWLGAVACMFLFFFGSGLAELRDEKNDPLHLLNQTRKVEYYSGYVSTPVEQKEKSKKIEVTIDKIYRDGEWILANGHVLLYIPVNAPELPYGTGLMIKGAPEIVPGPSNPAEFDYRRYLNDHHIYHRHFLKNGQFEILPLKGGNPVLSFSYSMRYFFDDILKKYVPGNDEYKIASALLLGIRSGLSEEIREAYSATGTIHVLAISGMHVTVVFQLLMLVFVFVPQGSFRNRLLIFVSLFLFLWLFAFISGFSPSVIRAVFMFSVILLSKLIRRHTNIYNTLFFAAFCLLLYDPKMIVDTGFQLSFLAVLGIVYFSDRIYYLKEFNNRFVDRVWRISSVSLAAQLSVLPLTLFYFKQIPVYFLVANLVAIPLSSVILYGGILLISVSWIPFLNEGFGWGLSKLIWLMNQFISYIGNLPGVVIQNIQIDSFQLIVLYILLIVIAAFFYYKKLFYLKITLLLVFLFSSLQIVAGIRKQIPEIVVFNIPNHLAVGFIENNKATLLLDSVLKNDTGKFDWNIQPYLDEKGVKQVEICVPDEGGCSFVRSISGGEYLGIFNSKIILFSSDPEKGGSEGFDYRIGWSKRGRRIQNVRVFSGNTKHLLYSSESCPHAIILKP